jgi:hypothetical protein
LHDPGEPDCALTIARAALTPSGSGEAQARAALGRLIQAVADVLVDAATPDLVSTWPPGTLFRMSQAAAGVLALTPSGSGEAQGAARLRDAFLRLKATGDHTMMAGFAVEVIPMLLDKVAALPPSGSARVGQG